MCRYMPVCLSEDAARTNPLCTFSRRRDYDGVYEITIETFVIVEQGARQKLSYAQIRNERKYGRREVNRKISMRTLVSC